MSLCVPLCPSVSRLLHVYLYNAKLSAAFGVDVQHKGRPNTGLNMHERAVAAPRWGTAPCTAQTH